MARSPPCQESAAPTVFDHGVLEAAADLDDLDNVEMDNVSGAVSEALGQKAFVSDDTDDRASVDKAKALKADDVLLRFYPQPCLTA
eukprot:5079511-Pyramimonas_sp.AAC.1